VDISHRPNQLRKDPFHFLDRERAVAEEVVVEFVAYTIGESSLSASFFPFEK
jgi:hypothetical protein